MSVGEEVRYKAAARQRRTRGSCRARAPSLTHTRPTQHGVDDEEVKKEREAKKEDVGGQDGRRSRRGPVLYGEKRRTSASSVSPFNSHRCPSSVLGSSFVPLCLSSPFLALLAPLLPLSRRPSLFPFLSFCLSSTSSLPLSALLPALFLSLSLSFFSSFSLSFSFSLCFRRALFVFVSQIVISLVRSPISSLSSERSP